MEKVIAMQFIQFCCKKGKNNMFKHNYNNIFVLQEIQLL